MILQGRALFYEGYPCRNRDFGSCYDPHGRKTLIVTSSGGINPDFEPGDVMVIKITLR